MREGPLPDKTLHCNRPFSPSGDIAGKWKKSFPEVRRPRVFLYELRGFGDHSSLGPHQKQDLNHQSHPIFRQIAGEAQIGQISADLRHGFSSKPQVSKSGWCQPSGRSSYCWGAAPRSHGLCRNTRGRCPLRPLRSPAVHENTRGEHAGAANSSRLRAGARRGPGALARVGTKNLLKQRAPSLAGRAWPTHGRRHGSKREVPSRHHATPFGSVSGSLAIGLPTCNFSAGTRTKMSKQTAAQG